MQSRSLAEATSEQRARRLHAFNAWRLTPGVAPRHQTSERMEEDLRAIERRVLHSEPEAVRHAAARAPTQADDFVAWFAPLDDVGPRQHDPLCPWLADHASRDEMIWFIRNEIAAEAGFEDLVALTQVKMPPRAKLELARNYWDEMGQGHLGGMHGPMLARLAEELGLGKTPADEIVWESLALANLMEAKAIHRPYAYRSIGALGVIELTAPGRACMVNAGLKRLGLGGDARRYFALHSTLNVKHSEAWNAEVIAPLVAADPRVASFRRARSGTRRVSCAPWRWPAACDQPLRIALGSSPQAGSPTEVAFRSRSDRAAKRRGRDARRRALEAGRRRVLPPLTRSAFVLVRCGLVRHPSTSTGQRIETDHAGDMECEAHNAPPRTRNGLRAHVARPDFARGNPMHVVVSLTKTRARAHHSRPSARRTVKRVTSRKPTPELGNPLMYSNVYRILACLALIGPVGACGDDDSRVTADTLGVGAQCTMSSECLQPDPPCDGGAGCFPQVCLAQFKGGYCGIQNCTGNADCPEGSACVAHDDSFNYCFRRCDSKDDCNANRDTANEASCSSSITFVDPTTTGKACVPSSSGL